jgi:hypothetical protein
LNAFDDDPWRVEVVGTQYLRLCRLIELEEQRQDRAAEQELDMAAEAAEAAIFGPPVADSESSEEEADTKPEPKPRKKKDTKARKLGIFGKRRRRKSTHEEEETDVIDLTRG